MSVFSPFYGHLLDFYLLFFEKKWKWNPGGIFRGVIVKISKYNDASQLPDEVSIKMRLPGSDQKSRWFRFLKATDYMKSMSARLMRLVDAFLLGNLEGTDTRAIADGIAVLNLVYYFRNQGEEVKASLIALLIARTKNQPQEVQKALFNHIENFNFEKHHQ